MKFRHRMLWGHTAASDLKGLGSFGCPYPPYSTKNRPGENESRFTHFPIYTEPQIYQWGGL